MTGRDVRAIHLHPCCSCGNRRGVLDPLPVREHHDRLRRWGGECVGSGAERNGHRVDDHRGRGEGDLELDRNKGRVQSVRANPNASGVLARREFSGVGTNLHCGSGVALDRRCEDPVRRLVDGEPQGRAPSGNLQDSKCRWRNWGCRALYRGE